MYIFITQTFRLLSYIYDSNVTTVGKMLSMNF